MCIKAFINTVNPFGKPNHALKQLKVVKMCCLNMVFVSLCSKMGVDWIFCN